MSLTSEFGRKGSPFRSFCDAHLTSTSELRRDWVSTLGDKHRLWPYPEGARPPHSALGLAYDYRIRLALGDEFKSMRAWKGLSGLVANAAGSRERSAAAEVVNAWSRRVRENGLPVTDHELTRDCIILAWLEELYRGGLRIRSPLYSLRPGAGEGELFGLVDDLWVDDVVEMFRAMNETVAKWSTGTTVFGPSFLGSADLGGADADLIAGRCLVEVKTSSDRTPTRRTLCQLAGYLLLDYDDEYGIEAVGICSGRWATFHEWGVDEFLAKFSGVLGQTVPYMRQNLREALR